MPIANRLQKLLPALSPLQRAVLVLKAQAAGVEVERSVIGPLVEGERRAFNRLMGLLYVANVEVRAAFNTVDSRVPDLDLLCYNCDFLLVAAADLEEQLGEEAPSKPVKNWRKRKDVTPAIFLRGLAEEMRAETLIRLLSLRQELDAIQVVLEELSSEFGGEDVIVPEFRAALAELDVRLRGQAAQLGYKGAGPVSNESFVDTLRSQIDRAMQQLQLVEVGT